MLLDASSEGTIRVLPDVQVKELIEKMSLNEYHSPTERGVQVFQTADTPQGVFALETYIAILAQIELLNKRFAKNNLN